MAAAVAAVSRRPGWARRLLFAVFAGTGGAVVVLAWQLVTGDFSVAYVADQSARAAPWHYRLAGLWGGMEGSLALWVWLLAGHAVVAARLVRATRPDLVDGTAAVLAAALALFLVPLVTVARPFTRLAVPALDGGGLAPVLEHPAMLYHPPLLYLGYTGLAVPFAVTLAALAAGRLDRGWVALCRRTTLLAWVPLTAGVATGAHWAYAELGWGGFWAWDPVENAALMPWLAAGALLHTVARARAEPGDGDVAPGARGLAALVTGTFALSVLGAWITRSGATVSVHAFAEARAVGRVVLAGLVVTMGGSAVLLARRGVARGAAWPRPSGPGAVALAAAPLALLGACGVVLFGTVVPLLSGLVLDRPMVAAPRFFTTFAGPFAVVLAVGLAVWTHGAATGRRASRPSPPWRRRGVLVAHAGAALVLLGLAGSAFGTATTATLAPGESVDAGPYTVRLERLTEQDGPRRRELGAVLAVQRDRRQVARLHPELHAYAGRAQPQSESALRSTPLADLLVTPRRIDLGAQAVTLDLFVKPLVLWLWVGAGLVVAGAAMAAAAGGVRPAATVGVAAGGGSAGASPPRTRSRPAPAAS